jgi:hypothetical protein
MAGPISGWSRSRARWKPSAVLSASPSMGVRSVEARYDHHHVVEVVRGLNC